MFHRLSTQALFLQSSLGTGWTGTDIFMLYHLAKGIEKYSVLGLLCQQVNAAVILTVNTKFLSVGHRPIYISTGTFFLSLSFVI